MILRSQPQALTRAPSMIRLEEWRRICQSYLAAWPDPADILTQRIMPENHSFIKANASMPFLMGLIHGYSDGNILGGPGYLRVTVLPDKVTLEYHPAV